MAGRSCVAIRAPVRAVGRVRLFEVRVEAALGEETHSADIADVGQRGVEARIAAGGPREGVVGVDYVRRVSGFFFHLVFKLCDDDVESFNMSKNRNNFKKIEIKS